MVGRCAIGRVPAGYTQELRIRSESLAQSDGALRERPFRDHSEKRIRYPAVQLRSQSHDLRRELVVLERASQVDAARARVGNLENHFRGKLSLNVEIPGFAIRHFLVSIDHID